MFRGREAQITVLAIALILGVVAGVYTELNSQDRALESAAAKPAPVEQAQPVEQAEPESEPTIPPKQRAQAQDEKNPPHVRLSNVKLLHPPQKKDFSKVDAPKKDIPSEDEDAE